MQMTKHTHTETQTNNTHAHPPTKQQLLKMNLKYLMKET